MVYELIIRNRFSTHSFEKGKITRELSIKAVCDIHSCRTSISAILQASPKYGAFTSAYRSSIYRVHCSGFKINLASSS